jgi:putative addiction module killer protein
MTRGHYGDYKSIGNGVYELRFTFGSGYRIYFAEQDNVVVLLLCGGDKSTQRHDIELAKNYWLEFRRCLL